MEVLVFLWRKSLSKCVNILGMDDSGRCMAIMLNLISGLTVKLVNVYFPCFSNNSSYSSELGNCLGFINSIVEPQDTAIVIGDVNFECVESNAGFSQCKSVFDQLNIVLCDDKVSNINPVTYVNEHLKCSSFIDHCFISTSLRRYLSTIDIIDSAINLSDHRPVVAHFSFEPDTGKQHINYHCNRDNKLRRYVWRWDKSNLCEYYDATRVHISPLMCLPFDMSACDDHCSNVIHCNLIDEYCQDIIACIHAAANQTVVKIPCNSLKPYWNDELDRLKEAAIAWHNIWTSAGKPQSGQLFHIKCSTQLKYKLAIRDSYVEFENKHDDAIYQHFINKKPSAFWKSWNAKFRRNINKNIVIEGCQTDKDIADKFATHFASVYHQACTSGSASYSQCVPNVYPSDNHSRPNFELGRCVTPELIDKCIARLAKGKASGPDDLTAEHIIYAHPSLIIALCNLYKLILIHRYVPNKLCIGTIVPLIKDKSRNLNDIDNYRPITLTSVIAKIFEHVVLSLCEDYLVSDELQFGFKRDISCADAIFVLRTTVDYFNARGSTMYLASLDIKKAFDTVNHEKLFISIAKTGVPQPVIEVLRNWYNKLFVSVRWGSSYSDIFAVLSGTRQGSVISPTLFNMFVNAFITNLRAMSIGCTIKSVFLGCLLYADDMILLCPSVRGLQTMLDNCNLTASYLELRFNASKSSCLAIGKLAKELPHDMLLGTESIRWVTSIKYLGIVLSAQSKITFNSNIVKQNFFAACNCIYAHAKTLDEIIHLTMQECYCLPVLTYAASVVKYTSKQEDELNACWNSVYRKIFGFNRWESVKCFICGLGRLDFHHVIRIRRVKFYTHAMHVQHSVINNVFWMFMSELYCKDPDISAVVFKREREVIDDIILHFNIVCA